MSARVIPLQSPRGAGDPEWTDDAVAAACATGDPRAVAELYDRFREPVLRFLRRAVPNGEDAEDLLQEVFMQIARRKAHFEGRSAVRTWLIGIAANMVRHQRRGFARRRRLAGALKADPAGAGTIPPAADADVRRRLLAAREALEALPDDLRLAFVLCELEGLSAREAAETLRTSEAAVWKRVSRARAQIRAAVESEGSRHAM